MGRKKMYIKRGGNRCGHELFDRDAKVSRTCALLIMRPRPVDHVLDSAGQGSFIESPNEGSQYKRVDHNHRFGL